MSFVCSTKLSPFLVVAAQAMLAFSKALPPYPLKSQGRTNRMGASLVAESVTNKEIARFWMQKRIAEEEHLFDAIKAAARIRARKLTAADYLRFELYIEEVDEEKENISNKLGKKAEIEQMIRGGIKDWWTKSIYAYLNQPAKKLVHIQKHPYFHTYLRQNVVPN